MRPSISRGMLGFEHSVFGCVEPGAAQDRHKHQSEKSWMSAKTVRRPHRTRPRWARLRIQSRSVHVPPKAKSCKRVHAVGPSSRPRPQPAPVICPSLKVAVRLPSNRKP